MPRDSKGNFHLSTARAKMADSKGPSAPPAPKPPLGGLTMGAPPAEEGSVHQHLRDVRDEMGGKHMLISHDGMSLTSHKIGEGGEPEGPEEHSTPEEAKEAMDRFFNEEAQEPEHRNPHEEY